MKTLFFILINLILIFILWIAIFEGMSRTVDERWEWQKRQIYEFINRR